ncbi:hypothetical protein PoB_004564900 [Plakobranchus ocellatus]|uniref:CIDE-N domain-containing protein n=1 Tax=Plakobranchus ocellatus TaxID=259542 RepID=A0AAV4BGC9_9GAST|nr:hypothetical protein PoB_004564900 [Plakobranchus ocellatus]
MSCLQSSNFDLKKLAGSFSSIFSDRSGSTKVEKHHIELMFSRQRPYRQNPRPRGKTTDATDTSLPNIEHGQSASSEKSIRSRDQQGDHDTHGESDDESAEEIIVETTDATDTSLPNIEHGQSASSEKSIPSRNQQGDHDTHGGSADESAGEIIVEKPDEETFVKTKMEEEISVDEITQVKNVSDQRKPHPFKVWNRDRTLKKAVLGSSLHTLIQIDLENQEIKVDELYLYRDSKVLAKIFFFPTGQFQSIEENPKRPTRPFKVWNSDRTKKYAVMASSLQTLIQKGTGN